MTPSLVSVVVVSYNTKDKLRRCLECIEPVHETIVVDNASSDRSAEMVATEFPNAILIRNRENAGFGQANNQGVAAASRPHVLFLNSDAYAFPGAIQMLSDELQNAGVVAVGGRLMNLDESLQLSTAEALTLWAVFCEQSGLEKLAPSSPFLSPYWTTLRIAGRDEPVETEQVMGACLMVDASKLPPSDSRMLRPWSEPSQSELFDPRYFLYCEDTDLCRRLRLFGRIEYLWKARFYHELGSSSSKERWRSVARYNRGKELYFSLHHGGLAAVACWCLNRLGALLRLLMWLVLFPKSRGRIGLFARVLFAPVTGPPDPRR